MYKKVEYEFKKIYIRKFNTAILGTCIKHGYLTYYYVLVIVH